MTWRPPCMRMVRTLSTARSPICRCCRRSSRNTWARNAVQAVHHANPARRPVLAPPRLFQPFATPSLELFFLVAFAKNQLISREDGWPVRYHFSCFYTFTPQKGEHAPREKKGPRAPAPAGLSLPRPFSTRRGSTLSGSEKIGCRTPLYDEGEAVNQNDDAGVRP